MAPVALVVLGFSLAGEVDACQRSHGRDRGQQQHGIRFGDTRLDAKQDRARHHEGCEEAPRGGYENERGPIGQQNSTDRAEERGQAIEPNGCPRAAHAKRLAGLHRGCLQPVDSDRLFVSNLVLKPDIDDSRFDLQHLLCRLVQSVPRRDRPAVSGRNPAGTRANENTTRSAIARRCDATAKSTAAVRLRAKPIEEPVSSVVVLTLSETLTR